MFRDSLRAGHFPIPMQTLPSSYCLIRRHACRLYLLHKTDMGGHPTLEITLLLHPGPWKVPQENCVDDPWWGTQLCINKFLGSGTRYYRTTLSATLRYDSSRDRVVDQEDSAPALLVRATIWKRERDCFRHPVRTWPCEEPTWHGRGRTDSTGKPRSR